MGSALVDHGGKQVHAGALLLWALVADRYNLMISCLCVIIKLDCLCFGVFIDYFSGGFYWKWKRLFDEVLQSSVATPETVCSSAGLVLWCSLRF